MKTIQEHLDEMRYRLLISAAALIATSSIAYAYQTELLGFLLIHAKTPLNYLNPADGFIHTWKVIFYTGAALASPVILAQLFLFLGDAVSIKKRSTLLRYALCSSALFALGSYLAFYYLIPYTLDFFSTYASNNITAAITLDGYLSFVLSMCLIGGIIAQAPLVGYIARRYDIIQHDTMRAYNSHFILAALILAAVLTPTTDAFTLLIVAIPLIAGVKLGLLLGGV